MQEPGPPVDLSPPPPPPPVLAVPTVPHLLLGAGPPIVPSPPPPVPPCPLQVAPPS